MWLGSGGASQIKEHPFRIKGRQGRKPGNVQGANGQVCG